ncbi:bifunctional DNA primase/polymerase [Nonomuraea fuscirosea]|uniref:bifunctional DNA primase/polymerase n=1 Tax=Nonomuraea fuscirosea TaxID=1291556 RepID=UPI002DDBAAC2|nr:bifunctional DNA primase/polymerase [Nonomuraea fuscirosea]WSA48284.1 bifunctional DNA primase/polymerase [Nonomuraea fuscirosea]
MTTPHRHDTTATALGAAARGWPVFPIAVGDKAPPRGFTDWESRATRDPERIRAWWRHAPFNVGIATGPAGLVVIDLDTPKPGQRPPREWDLPGVIDGADVFALLCQRAGVPIEWETLQVRTRRGGLHLYYTAPPGVRLPSTNGGLGWLIDTRAWGGYVVAPGSTVTLPDGTGRYTVQHATAPAPLPPSLFKLLKPALIPAKRPVHVPIADDRHSAYLRAALDRELAHLAAAQPGQRNRSLFGAAAALGELIAGGALPEQPVKELLEQGGGDLGLSRSEVIRTIESGLRHGARRPRHLATV